MEEMVSKIINAIQERALDTAGRHREQKNEKLKSKTKVTDVTRGSALCHIVYV